jgi:CBS domain-containing protein
MKTVREILAAKGHHVWSVDAGSSVFDALLLMAEKNIGAVLVTEGDRPAGIMTERDYARKVVLKSRISRETPVREIMVWNPVCVRPEQSVEDCMKIMTTKRFRHLPVTDSDKLVGMVSIGDVVKAVISDQQYKIEQLEHYITGA